MTVDAFTSLDHYLALPRVESLALSPDGQRIILVVATLSHDRTTFERALWSVAPDGSGSPARLTRSAKGESGVAFTGPGDAVFVSSRVDTSARKNTPAENTEKAQLWILPRAGGEARPLTRLAGGVSGIAAVASRSETIVVDADLLPGASDLESEAALRARRAETKVAAILHESYPVRYWDHDLGPAEPHLLALDVGDFDDAIVVPAPSASAPSATAPSATAPSASAPSASASSASAPSASASSASDGAAASVDAVEADVASTPYPSDLPRPRDLTPAPGRTADTAGQALTPDGRTLIAAMQVPETRSGRFVLVSMDLSSGEQTTLFDEPRVHFESPVVSNDGTRLAYLRSAFSTPNGPADQELWTAGIDGSAPVRLAAKWDRWPTSIMFDLGDEALVVTADQGGRGPIFRIPLDGGAPEQLTVDDFSYTDVALDVSTGDLIALRSSWVTPPHPVRIDRVGVVTALATPAPLPDVPGTITEVQTTAEDGADVRGWLLLPEGASAQHPAPLLLWIHGGPLNSWNAWSWRWNPLLAVARGYAVLLPDPALSTGYGLDFIARGWNSWGGAPFTDLMRITDAAESRDDIDASKTAALGGSFGGYMANWVAGHTDRFRAIVSHASLWALDQFAGTTDHSEYWQSIFDADGMSQNSPHHAVADIVTPMLVIHGDKDYRVPLGESLRLWSELAEHHAGSDGRTPHKFLFFPDENHWILKPQHALVWYETVFAFLDTHLHGAEWKRPELLG